MDNINFKLLRFCYNKSDSVRKLQPEKIPYMDLTYCISGKMHYIYENKEYVLKDGDAILFPQGAVRVRRESNDPAIYCSFNISYEDFVPEVSGYLPNSVGFDTVRVLESVRKCFESVSDKKQEKCIALFWYLYYQLIESAENNENPHIKNMKKYIEKHYKEKMTLEEIASEVHLAPEYCSALFAKQTGQTLFDFIANQRIEDAKGLIITTDYSLTKIAELSGFDDYNYFSRVFKKIAGMNARDYRRLNKNL